VYEFLLKKGERKIDLPILHLCWVHHTFPHSDPVTFHSRPHKMMITPFDPT